MLYAQSERGRCRSCGFLAKHPVAGTSLPTPRFYEIERYERKLGTTYVQLFMHRPDMAAHGYVQVELACFVEIDDLMADIRDIPATNADFQGQRVDAAVDAIAKERRCSAWYPYSAGFSPIQHYEEYKMHLLEADRRDFDLRLAETNQKAQDNSLRVAEASKTIVGDLKDIALANDRFTRRVTALVIVLAVLQTIGTVIALPSIPWVQRLWHHFFG